MKYVLPGGADQAWIEALAIHIYYISVYIYKYIINIIVFDILAHKFAPTFICTVYVFIQLYFCYIYCRINSYTPSIHILLYKNEFCHIKINVNTQTKCYTTKIPRAKRLADKTCMPRKKGLKKLVRLLWKMFMKKFNRRQFIFLVLKFIFRI